MRAQVRASISRDRGIGTPAKGKVETQEQLQKLLARGARSIAWPEERRKAENRVLGCTTRTWLEARRCRGGKGVEFEVDSDSQLTRGVGAIACEALRGKDAQQVARIDVQEFGKEIGLSQAFLAPSHANGFQNLVNAMKKRAAVLQAQDEADGADVPEAVRFPSLRITADDVEAEGSFAAAQAQFLRPDLEQVKELVHVIQEKRIGVVAHFYMDPEVQGVLSEAALDWPHICISDSLLMADKAVAMVKEGGCKSICVLGVDFMSENVRAILDEAGHKDVQVYRMASDAIGCSLAEAAESLSYETYLKEASKTPNSVHVVYINTSLRTKARAHGLVPTITCTSSNVVQTVLTAYAQIPGVTVWYGPDTYMGANIEKLLTDLSEMDDAAIQELHPDHNRETIKSILPRFKYFKDGSCIVHDLFGGEVCDTVRTYYRDTYLTAHFEVPGEMFILAMEAKQRGMGVVGSTQNILDFICHRLDEAIHDGETDETLRFVLGTESGMITSIVRHVQAKLKPVVASHPGLAVEVIFPVSTDAISRPEEQPAGLGAVPGTLLSEGCSLSGGCASCPYMKMNSLDALQHVCREIPADGTLAPALGPFLPKKYAEDSPIPGLTLAGAGCIPILHMRGFQRTKRLPSGLAEDITTRNSTGSTLSPAR
eukprot:scaffold574_cov333-Pavlova_lutheri.AAC.29